MLYTYIAVITRGTDKCYARIPDIAGCITTGKGLEYAVVQITDALRGCLMVLRDNGFPIPQATPQQDIPHGVMDLLVSVSFSFSWFSLGFAWVLPGFQLGFPLGGLPPFFPFPTDALYRFEELSILGRSSTKYPFKMGDKPSGSFPPKA